MPDHPALYPPIEPYVTHSLAVDATHTLYVEECGNPNGIPILFVHGGPGGSFSPIIRQFFNPGQYRVILFDQRGCGQSTPHASLGDNTSQHLVDDIERIRIFLDVETWALFGGSWGSTLSLLYAEAHPERVTALILRGIFLCRDEDTAWFYQSGANRFCADYWPDFIAPIAPENRGHMIKAYYDILTGDDKQKQLEAAKAWSFWEGRMMMLSPDPSLVDHFSEPEVALALARIECHYFINQCFLKPEQILNQADRIRDIPTTIIHGRYDMICPVNQAFELKAQLPAAKLVICNHAGHSAMEPEITQALVDATNETAERLAI